jgi:hypothetical protein
MQLQGHNINPNSLLNIATITSLGGSPHHTDYDDEPVRSNTLLTDLNAPHLHIITVPTFSQPTYGLIRIASRQVIWIVGIPDSSIPSTLLNFHLKALLLQVPTFTKCNVDIPRPARDKYTIYCPTFRNKPAIRCYRLFRETVWIILHVHLSTYEHGAFWHRPRGLGLVELGLLAEEARCPPISLWWALENSRDLGPARHR